MSESSAEDDALVLTAGAASESSGVASVSSGAASVSSGAASVSSAVVIGSFETEFGSTVVVNG